MRGLPQTWASQWDGSDAMKTLIGGWLAVAACAGLVLLGSVRSWRQGHRTRRRLFRLVKADRQRARR